MRSTRTLLLSILLNSILAGTLGYMVLRLGGLKYVFYRMGHNEAGLYAHRSQHFDKMPVQKGCIVFVGDSQVEQCEWAELFQGTTQVPILNRGITADQVMGLSNRLPEILRHNPSKVFLLIGINDLLFEKPYTDIAATYHDIVKRIRAQNKSTQIYIISVLPVNNNIRNLGITNEAVVELNTRLQQLARSFAIPYIDAYSQLLDTKSADHLSPLFTQDGLHLNGLGYQVVKKLLGPSI